MEVCLHCLSRVLGWILLVACRFEGFGCLDIMVMLSMN